MTTNDNTQRELDSAYEILKMHQAQLQKMTELLREHSARLLQLEEDFHQFRTETENKLDGLENRVYFLESEG